MPSHERIPTSIHSEAFLARLMREQLRLSILCAGAFVIALFGLPLCNYFFPEVMARRVGGFTISWLILGVLLHMKGQEADLACKKCFIQPLI